MKLSYKKGLRLLTLLVISAIIATVSAASYNYLVLNASIGVSGQTLAWEQGTDGLGYTPAGATCSISGLTGPAGGIKEYTDAVRLTATATTTFNLLAASVTGSGTTQMDSIVVQFYDGGVAQGSALTVWDGDSIGSPVTGLSITTGHTWNLHWTISWKSTATTESVDVQLKVEIPV